MILRKFLEEVSPSKSEELPWDTVFVFLYLLSRKRGFLGGSIQKVASSSLSSESETTVCDGITLRESERQKENLTLTFLFHSA